MLQKITAAVQITDLSSKQSENIQNEVLTITSEHPSFEDHFDKNSANITMK